jgi:hypothetical protein
MSSQVLPPSFDWYMMSVATGVTSWVAVGIADISGKLKAKSKKREDRTFCEIVFMGVQNLYLKHFSSRISKFCLLELSALSFSL